MDHGLVSAVEKALGWSGAEGLGGSFQRGSVGSPQLLRRLFPLHRLFDVLMRRSLESPQVRVFREGQELHPQVVLEKYVTPRGQSLSMVNMYRLAAQLERGVTLVLDRANVLDPTMEAASRALQWWARERVQVNAYLTTNEADGFHLHWDDHDVLVMQLAGEKEWEIRGPSRAFPLFRDLDPNLEPPEEVIWKGTVRAGDIMHIPRGFWHAAGRTGLGEGLSFHVTFGFAKLTGASWASWAADQSREYELFRQDLIRNGDAGDSQQASALSSAFSQLVASSDADKFITHRDRETPPGRHIPWMPIFGPLTAVVCVTEYPPYLVHEGGRFAVYAAGRVVRFPPRLEPMIREVLSGNPVELGELTGMVREAVEILVRENVCAPLTPELAAGYDGIAPTIKLD